MNISQQEAKRIMDSGEDCIILDVRGAEEYEQGHIPGATLLPLSELPARAEEELPDYEQQILVYCRSGTRSASAAIILESMGYTNIKDFGGIMDWTYDITTD